MEARKHALCTKAAAKGLALHPEQHHIHTAPTPINTEDIKGSKVRRLMYGERKTVATENNCSVREKARSPQWKTIRAQNRKLRCEQNVVI